MRKLAICLILMTLICSIFGLKGERYALDGIEYYQRGEYQKAISQFLMADRSAGGKVPEYQYWLGRLYIAVADTTHATTWLGEYLNSGDPEYRLQVEDYFRIIQRQKQMFRNINVRPMPDYVNSRNSDYGAISDPDGKYLYFTSLRPANLAKENIWRSEIFRSGFGKPELVTKLSSDKNEAFGCFTQDQSGAWIFGNYEKSKRDGDIYYVSTGENWAEPLNVLQLNSTQVETHPMEFRGRLLFFASSRKGGLGGMDIYVSEKIGGLWTEPQNLGPVINTADNEQTPFLDFDGRTLFFASRGHSGFGGYDIFKAYRIGNSWQAWSLPENLGLPVNSTRNDRYFYHLPASNQGFISSDRNVDGFEKIYRVSFDYTKPASYLVLDGAGIVTSYDIVLKVPSQKKAADESSIWTLIDQGLEVLKVGLPEVAPTTNLQARNSEQAQGNILPNAANPLRVEGKVTDQNGNPVPAEVEFSGQMQGEQTRSVISASEQGSFSGTLIWSEKLSVVVNLEGYLLYSDDFKIAPSADSLNLSIILQKFDKKKSISFMSIHFNFDSYQIRPDEINYLDNIVLSLHNNPEIRVKISGHAFDPGATLTNKELSELRAQVVANYLISKGIDKKRVSWKGYGNSKAVVGYTLQTDQASNRRVEIEALK